MPISESVRLRMMEKLQWLYGDDAGAAMQRIDELADRYEALRDASARPLWNERSVVLITYGDQVQGDGHSALEAQRKFLLDFELDQVISVVHILPFFPYSSDDGFSVIDYRAVNPDVGEWKDIDRLGNSFEFMFDFVVNHCSQHNEWFQRYLKGEAPFKTFFIDVDPATDMSTVTRPRSSPLLTPYETANGTKHVWTTFSADQVDLNFSSPDVLIEMFDILLFYIKHGAQVIRLDAIGFLWKRIGTNCMHLAETHAVVKLMRDLVDDVAPGTILLTETNVPHEENISYFGAGDEAHAVYQFTLAPLLLDALLTGDAQPLKRWLAGLKYPGEQMTFFNFTASHDGIGVRPLEGLVTQERLDALVESVLQRGGLVNMRRKPDGTNSPYELNVAYLSALDSPEGLPPDLHARKFLTSQAVMLALRGVPGIYFQSLVGTANFHEGVMQTGRNRTINRRKFDSNELREIIGEESSVQRKIFEGYRKMLAVRIKQSAFHPDADQEVLDLGGDEVIAFARTSQDGNERIVVLSNVADHSVTVDLSTIGGLATSRDLLSGKSTQGTQYELEPYATAWLV